MGCSRIFRWVPGSSDPSRCGFDVRPRDARIDHHVIPGPQSVMMAHLVMPLRNTAPLPVLADRGCAGYPVCNCSYKRASGLVKTPAIKTVSAFASVRAMIIRHDCSGWQPLMPWLPKFSPGGRRDMFCQIQLSSRCKFGIVHLGRSPGGYSPVLHFRWFAVVCCKLPGVTSGWQERFYNKMNVLEKGCYRCGWIRCVMS